MTLYTSSLTNKAYIFCLSH